MSFGFGFGLPRAPLRGRPLVAAIRSLFANSEPGVWYDPSDLSTLFQDSAGTTPVTAVEQPVGLMLDKSKGLVLGPELVTNGDFSNGTTGWVAQQSTIQAQNGACLVSVTGVDGRVEKTINLDPSKRYLISADLNSLGVSSAINLIRGFVGNYQFIERSQIVPIGQSRRVSFIANPTGSDCIVQVRQYSGALSGQFSVDNISVRELPGNHASQTTATSRPVLSARVNLLTKTEQFDDAAWTRTGLLPFGSGSVANTTATTDPLGGNTADLVVEDTSNGEHITSFNFAALVASGASMSASCYMKAETGRYGLIRFSLPSGYQNAIFDLQSGAVDSAGSEMSASIESAGNGWYRCTASGVRGFGAFLVFGLSNGSTNSYTGDGTSGLYIWGASLVPANQAHLPYQRVNTATDYDTAGFPHYLRFDGVDDWMVTNTITPGIDKVQVFAGVRKLSDAAFGMITELSTSLGTRPNTFYLAAPTGGKYEMASMGSIAVYLSSLAGSAPVPISSVLTGIGDISGDSAILRVNGTQAAQSTADQGTGNYLAHPLYIGCRGGTTLPFNGRLYSLIVRFGSNLPAATIEKTEKYINTQTRAY